LSEFSDIQNTAKIKVPVVLHYEAIKDN